MKNKVTMKEIADKLNLSINAVSLVLNDKSGISEKTRSLVLKTADEMGYIDQTSKYKKTFSSKNLAVLIKRIYFKDMHFYSRILLGLEQEAKKNNYDILISVLDDNEIPNCIENRKTAGIFIVGKVETEYLMKVKQYGIPVILVDTTSSIEETDSVMTDNRLGGYQAIRYLIQKGYRKIGFFGDLGYTVSVRERYWGYLEAIKHMPGIDDYFEASEYSEQYSVVADIEQDILNNDTAKIIERVKSVKKMPEVFFCSNDNAAILLCNSLRHLNYRIPEDISVMGFDDVDLSNMVIPKLTTIRVNKEMIGSRAIQLFIWRLEHKNDPPEKVLISTEVIERDSVGSI
ncbi:LacI family transcriptional regulator [Anaerotaenia torta]|uniref:LacI family DNA-binding transcriptional regulator n=1 Tax=Anaerotaenia torta TaxID=433293 RepID=UPI003D1F9D72